MLCAGDGAASDENWCIWIKDCVDRIINESGHLSPYGCNQSAFVHTGVSEAAVIDPTDELASQTVYGSSKLKPEFKSEDEPVLLKALIFQVRKVIGPFVVYKKVYVVADLPKTMSGKITRRIMRKIVPGEGDQLGYSNTLAERAVGDNIKKVAEST